MKLIDELFKRYRYKEETLIPYGFISSNNVYKYSKLIHDGAFSIELEINKGKIIGKLIDTDFNDEYNQINIDSISGGFISSLKQECEEILLDVRDKCFEQEVFIYPQTNRINKLIKDKYDVDPEFLWDKFPGYGVYRNKRSKKWFALISNVNKKKLSFNEDKEVEILNIILGEETSKYVNNINILTAYHMNKKNWVSILLDDSIKDEEIMSLIDRSFNFADIKTNWIIPANPKYYDVVSIFDKSDVSIWKQSSNINVGDYIYLYIAEPYSCILFKCEVVEVDIPYEYKDKNVSMQRIMRIKLIKKYEEGQWSYQRLNKYGITAIRGPRRIPDNLIKDL